MKNKLLYFLLLVFALQFSLPAFAHTKAASVVVRSQLETRELQTKIFDTPNKEEVLKAAIATLQDEGYMIINIEDELGYIEARREFNAVRIDHRVLHLYYIYFALGTAEAVCSYGSDTQAMIDAARRIHNEISPRTVVVNSNVCVDSFGKSQTRVRFTLVEKELENADGYTYIKASPRKVIRYYTPTIYQKFFSELDQNIYYDKEKV